MYICDQRQSITCKNFCKRIEIIFIRIIISFAKQFWVMLRKLGLTFSGLGDKSQIGFYRLSSWAGSFSSSFAFYLIGTNSPAYLTVFWKEFATFSELLCLLAALKGQSGKMGKVFLEWDKSGSESRIWCSPFVWPRRIN